MLTKMRYLNCNPVVPMDPPAKMSGFLRAEDYFPSSLSQCFSPSDVIYAFTSPWCTSRYIDQQVEITCFETKITCDPRKIVTINFPVYGVVYYVKESDITLKCLLQPA